DPAVHRDRDLPDAQTRPRLLPWVRGYRARWDAMREARRIGEVLWEIPADARPDMRVPARVFADEELFEAIERAGSPRQTENVATLPGIVEAALAMPDAHQGYGFPVGGVAATELPDCGGSAGGLGHDMS